MSPRSCFRVALRALAKNKLQTALTMIGLTIGVATVLTMIALGSGAQSSIQDQVKAAGMNLIVITAGNYKVKTEDDFGVVENARFEAPRAESPFRAAIWTGDDRPRFLPVFHPEDDPLEKHDHPTASQRLGDMEAGLGSAATLASGDAAAIRKLKGVQFVSEGVHENAHVAFGGKRWFTRLHGDDVSLPFIRRAWKFERGRFYTAREENNTDQVIVLGSVAAEKLFGDANPVGEIVKIWNQPFKVVGVVTSGSWLVAPAPGDDQFDAVYVPFTTVHRLLNLSKLNDITVTAASSGDVTRLSKGITELLRGRHKIGPTKPDDFTVTSQARQALAKGGMRPEVARSVVGNVDVLEKVTLEQLGKTLDRSSRTMTALLACIAAVSLLVGGIGIMNIMLLSVTERTKEIGIRRAIGARRKDVLLQFLMEATTLSVAGGLGGIAIGVAASIAIARWASWAASISFISVALAFGISAAVGIFFGYYPARQASEVAPMESLRYE
ncbi:MAG: ABC transporter permease [Bryobacterales bacterium]|nr:ABC transporter permease [Bryobacterales bacterium]MBV9399961.1 ABC transporter permease [Bryobacterales bacterium]